jgi:hypothetical protein
MLENKYCLVLLESIATLDPSWNVCIDDKSQALACNMSQRMSLLLGYEPSIEFKT